jgi:hypothetical protein
VTGTAPRTLIGRSVRQRVGPHVIAELRGERAVAAGDRNDILLAAGLILGHRRRLAACRNAVLPKLSAIANNNVSGHRRWTSLRGPALSKRWFVRPT